MEAFRVFDKNKTDIIETNVLKHILKGQGEPLNDEQIEILIKEADKDGTN